MSFWRSKPPPGTPIDKLHPLSQGLVGDWLMNEGGGGKVYDGSGFGNHGTLTNMAFPPTPTSGWNPGKDGVAIKFDAIDDSITVPTTPSLNSPFASWVTTFTLSASSTYRYLISHNGLSKFIIRTMAGIKLETRVVTNITSLYLSSATNLIANQWYQAVITYDGSFVKIYLNGILDCTPGSLTGNIASTIANLYFGSYGGGSNFFPGSVSRNIIYNRALQETEIAQLYSDPYCFLQQPQRVKYFIPTGVVEVYSSRGIARGVLRGILR